MIPRYAVSTGSTATRDERGGVAFAGYAAVFDVVDRAGDVMRRGAFAGAGVVPLLWQHRGGAVAGLSVGYRALRVRQGARRVIEAVVLVEVSLVAVPMQALARVEVVG